MNKQELITELQSKGLRWVDPNRGASGRKGGAGPSDHKAVTIEGTTVMVPIYTDSALRSPYTATLDPVTEKILLHYQEQEISPLFFPKAPNFYNLTTTNGIPYWKIALLHSQDVLATTVLQTCKRYRDPATACQFCAIEQSLNGDRTIARKTPDQLAEVTEEIGRAHV